MYTLLLWLGNSAQETCCISELLKDKYHRRNRKEMIFKKIAYLVAELKSVKPQRDGVCVTLTDSTGKCVEAHTMYTHNWMCGATCEKLCKSCSNTCIIRNNIYE